MYTGIVQAVLPIEEKTSLHGHTRYSIRFPEPLLAGLKIGGSVAVDGICMTASQIDGDLVSFDASAGTSSITNIADREVGDRVNIERSARSGDENGGHVVTGHVTGTAVITGIDTTGDVNFLQFRVPAENAKYVFVRGFLAVNGASLTVAEADQDAGLFRINLIPETIRQTSLADYRVGDRLNYEVELQTQIMVDTIERCFRQYGVRASA